MPSAGSAEIAVASDSDWARGLLARSQALMTEDGDRRGALPDGDKPA